MYEELYEHHFKEHHTSDYVRIEELEHQLDASQALLAEERAELSFWRAMDKDLTTGESIKDKIRQEAAREICARIMGGSFLHDQAPPKMFAREVSTMIKAKFKLEV
jgi:hypothetical protein